MHLLVQWHITGACNLRCGHCYDDGPRQPHAGMAEAREALRQVAALRQALARRSGAPVPLHLNITGGEPLLHPQLFALLAQIAGMPAPPTVGILSNGTLIDRGAARRLRAAGVSFVQVSIEGTAATHDALRGPGSYRTAASGLKALASQGVPAMISFTAHRANCAEFPAVARLGARLGARRVWADRLIPAGSGARLPQACLSPSETRDFIGLMDRCRRRHGRATDIGMHRALQFIPAGGRPYRCAAGGSLVTLMPDGTLYPCRRMPIAVGNIFATPLAELHRGHPLLRQLRAAEPPAACGACFYSEVCRGGLRCLSYAVHGDPFQADPGCWLAQHKEEHHVTTCAARSC